MDSAAAAIGEGSRIRHNDRRRRITTMLNLKSSSKASTCHRHCHSRAKTKRTMQPNLFYDDPILFNEPILLNEPISLRRTRFSSTTEIAPSSFPVMVISSNDISTGFRHDDETGGSHKAKMLGNPRMNSRNDMWNQGPSIMVEEMDDDIRPWRPRKPHQLMLRGSLRS
ncbi:hypothetical protein C8J56DRAFT_970649 [Mycena floridula]|nr:hypothetical protein C8J56DRAFT_978352 [Mycena floridula]KAJ7577318.1 hypothetical protein C8J56DRAFT_970649 [Mycena floridula]